MPVRRPVQRQCGILRSHWVKSESRSQTQVEVPCVYKFYGCQAHIKKLQEIANLVNSNNSLVLAVLSSVFTYIELWVGRDWAAVTCIIEVPA